MIITNVISCYYRSFYAFSKYCDMHKWYTLQKSVCWKWDGFAATHCYYFYLHMVKHLVHIVDISLLIPCFVQDLATKLCASINDTFSTVGNNKQKSPYCRFVYKNVFILHMVISLIWIWSQLMEYIYMKIITNDGIHLKEKYFLRRGRIYLLPWKTSTYIMTIFRHLKANQF